MEANLCLRTKYLSAMRRHKMFMVHSSVRLPALQARAGPPPGAARVAVVGAGVVLACALGAMYWKRALAVQFPMNRMCERVPHDDPIPTVEKLLPVLSEIFINPNPPRLTKIIDERLNKKDKEKVNKGQSLKSILEKYFPETITNDDYNFGLVFTLAMISEKEYAKADEICNKLIKDAPKSDTRPKLLLATIKMMIAMDSMMQPIGSPSSDDLKEKLKKVEKAWDDYCRIRDEQSFLKSPPSFD